MLMFFVARFDVTGKISVSRAGKACQKFSLSKPKATLDSCGDPGVGRATYIMK